MQKEPMVLSRIIFRKTHGPLALSALLILGLVPFSVSANLEEETVDPIVENSVFASNTTSLEKSSAGTQTIGPMKDFSDGYGVSYNRSLTPSARLHFHVLIASNDAPLFSKSIIDTHSLPEGTSSYANLTTKSSEAAIGIDQILHLTENRRWGVFIGFNLGVAQNLFREKYYPKTCSPLFCGFDSNSPTQKNITETYGFLNTRVGVQFNAFSIDGFPVEMIFSSPHTALRTGRTHRFESPDRVTFEALMPKKINLEILIQL